MKKKFVRRIFGAAVFLGFLFAAVQLMTTADATQSDQLTVKQENGKSILGTSSLGDFHRTERTISDTKIIQLPESNGKAIIWQEQGVGRKIPFYALSTDGKNVSRVQETSYDLMLRYASFDPLVSAPETPSALSAKTDGGENTYIVQFVTQPLEEYRAAIKNLGGKNYIYLPNHAQLVKMDAATKANVEALPFVRWVGHYQPAYKLEEFLLDSLSRNSLQPARYNVMVLERGKTMQDELAANIRALGGKVDLTIPEGFRMEVTLSPDQLVAVANDSDVLFIDRWSAPEADMEIVRATGGANFIEDTLGFKGEGVRAEVMDGGLLVTHTDFQSGNAPIVHGTINVDSHGTATYGINFGRGTTNPAARGMLPEAQGIIAGYPQLTNRYTHTARLKQDPYKAVYQSNSWGSTLTTAYNTISAEMDDILFKEDFVLLNSQSNAGTQQSRPQAWAKNVVSIGGVRHYNTASFDDDRWSNGASIGPAADGRIKPDLAHFYDSVHTTTSTSTTAYTTTFGGTSAATPITAGHFGIFFQMWHNGLFGNPTGATVFDSRPHMTTVKAVMINTAIQWNMTGTDLTRVRQGFGRANLQNLYNLRNKMMIVDESHVLTNTQSRSYTIKVAQGSTDPLKVTMVYADPMGSPSATRARINDLTLKVTAPDGSVYWGNNGIGVGGGMWSTSGGSANVIDTVENVFIQNPEAGNWTVEVIASEINQDARIETPNVVDADYSLVASGIVAQRKAAFDYDGDGKSDVSVFRPSNSTWYLNRSTSGFTAQQFGVSTDRLAPADYDGDGRTDVAVFRVNGNLATF
ncbi:MAG TPA: S8 family serine peptidase, partial [Pyrinomonadaceae bacterium]|nr:S8 family serine peptidase [Pyrinomonadaceae bacterium]